MIKRFFQKKTPPTPSLKQQYDQLITDQYIDYDSSQNDALPHLQHLLDQLTLQAKHKHLYLYGDVGRGKSLLMRLFFDACPFKKKRWLHFHAFMLEVYGFSEQWQQHNHSDALPVFAKRICASTVLLCLDEFHVSNIADAMIINRLFRLLFEHGVTVTLTSNVPPSNLYRDGLQRELFIPFIDKLIAVADIVELKTHTDYRFKKLKSLETTYHFPLDDQADQFIQQSYQKLTGTDQIQVGDFHVLGRTISLTSVHNDIALSSFKELCEQPLGPADYLEIAKELSTLIIADIPLLTPEHNSGAKRFVTLIDALYEHKVKLICSAEAAAQDLYRKHDRGEFEFKRTVSRLIEMQSESYLRLGHQAD